MTGKGGARAKHIPWKEKLLTFYTMAISMPGSKLFPSLLLLKVVISQAGEHVHLIHKHFSKAYYVPGPPLGTKSGTRIEQTLPSVGTLPAAQIRRRLHRHRVCVSRSWVACLCLHMCTHSRPPATTWAHQSPASPGAHLEHLPVHLRVGLHGVLREHEGDEGKALGLLGQAVDGVM